MFRFGLNRIKGKIDNIKKIITSIFYNIRIVCEIKYGKTYFVIRCILSLISSVSTIVFAIFPGFLINELIGLKRINVIVIYTSIIILEPVLEYFIQLFTNRYLEKLSLDIYLNLNSNFYTHTLRMDYEMYENPDIQLKKNRAQKAMGNMLGGINQIINILIAVINLIIISSIIFTLNPVIVFVIFIIIFVNAQFTKKIKDKLHILDLKMSEYDNQTGSIGYMLVNDSYAKEVRLFNLSEFLIEKYNNIHRKVNKAEYKYFKTSSWSNTILVLTNFFQQIMVYIYLVYQVIKKGLLIGDFSIYLSATIQLKDRLKNLMDSCLNLYARALDIENYIEFMDIPLNQYIMGDKKPIFNDNTIIEFRNVSFMYPGSEVYAIKELSIKINAKEKLCIVGKNGSGKSTFVKLLMRLYLPTKGEILVNGININEYDYSEYLNLFSPVFQDFAKYRLTFAENIILNKEYDEKKLKLVCNSNGLDLLTKKLSKGVNTQVGKYIDPEGFQPSGGEAQRIAIARACYHGGEIFILDEPTAALDPNAEYEIYTQFHNIITDKTAIIITHRLSAVQLADKVAVFDDGQVVEYGTHKELYAKGGIYTEMFDKQAKFYRDEVEEKAAEEASQ